MGFLDGIADSLGITQHGAKKAQKKQTKGIQELFAQLAAQQAQGFGAAQMQGNAALKSLQGGYKNALANSGLAATNAKKNVQQAGQQNLAGATQSLASRGLYNTTAFDAARRGVMADTQRSMSGIDAALASLQSGLEVSQAQAVSGQQDWLANLLMQQQGAQTNLGLNKASYLYGDAAGQPFNMNSLAPGGVNKLFQYGAFMFNGGGAGAAAPWDAYGAGGAV